MTQSGASVVSFTLAVHRPMTRDTADFIECVAWDERAEFIQRNFKKGMKIEVKGILTTRDYEKDGVRKKITEVRVEDAAFSGEAPRREEQ